MSIILELSLKGLFVNMVIHGKQRSEEQFSYRSENKIEL